MADLKHTKGKFGKGVGGFTLLELMIVVVIAGLLAVLAGPDLRRLVPRYRLNRGAKELAGNVQLARLMAISQGRDFRICMINGDTDPEGGEPGANVGEYTISGWNTEFAAGVGDWDLLPIEAVGIASDTNQGAGTYTLDSLAGSNGMRGISIIGWTAMGGPGIGNANCMVFSTRGWLDNPASDFDGGYINVQFQNKYALPIEEIRTVRVSRGGSISILDVAIGGEQLVVVDSSGGDDGDDDLGDGDFGEESKVASGDLL